MLYLLALIPNRKQAEPLSFQCFSRCLTMILTANKPEKITALKKSGLDTRYFQNSFGLNTISYKREHDNRAA